MVVRFAFLVFTAVGIVIGTTLLIGVCMALHLCPNFRIVAGVIVFAMGWVYVLANHWQRFLAGTISMFFVGVGGCLLFLAYWKADTLPMLIGATFWLGGTIGSNISADMWLMKRRTHVL